MSRYHFQMDTNERRWRVDVTGPSVFGFARLKIQDICCNYKFVVPSVLRPPGGSPPLL